MSALLRSTPLTIIYINIYTYIIHKYMRRTGADLDLGALAQHAAQDRPARHAALEVRHLRVCGCVCACV
jgi:hypothetical protein